MKARLWQFFFRFYAFASIENILAEESKKNIKDIKEQNIMSGLYQQTAAEKMAESVHTFK